MATPVTIDGALEAFLAAQRECLSAKTFRNYEDVVFLLRSSLNGYAYESLDELERKRWQKAFDAGTRRRSRNSSARRRSSTISARSSVVK